MRCMTDLSMESLDNDPAIPLRGPPTLYLPVQALRTDRGKERKRSTGTEFIDVAVSKEQAPNVSGDPFVDAMVNNYNYNYNYNYNAYHAPMPSPFMGYTENHSPTFYSSGKPCLVLFFHVVPDTPPNDMISLAWDDDPLTALKLVCNLRGVRGTGKGDREGFYAAAGWIHKNHPKTLAHNVKASAEFGYFKDLQEILVRILYSADVRAIQMRKRDERRWGQGEKLPLSSIKIMFQQQWYDAAKKGFETYHDNPDYRFLHIQVSRVYAGAMKKDTENIKAGIRDISFAAKWCPSLDSNYDRSMLLCESIGRILFP
ncbi:hypothetical protein RJ639_029172 [Escallonia herrerae]|uniref:DUF2828 domain-containing protein n=1 Tax=Escallonia herrerae TaxID=1293975 RepID=A0AA89BH46_9ASTE|nr:hypothetical protein RJ639_029172 [Escallonia herrerae]